MALELLKAVARLSPASDIQTLTPGMLRFSLQYRQAPDVAAARAALARLLERDGFALFPLPPGDDPEMLVLQFPAYTREQSPGFLFQTAAELAAALDLVSCVPDVAPGWREGDELGRAAPESIDGIVWNLCKSHQAAPTDPLWAARMVKADLAWARYGTQGEGIRIGQPDTGVADHKELDGALDTASGLDVILGGGPPTDPLSPSMASPGHGTATSSSIASRPSGRMVGTAPGATVVPIRCVDGVVISGGAAVAAAIDHARHQSCHVVSMSLGGPVQFRDLQRAIGRAVDANMIVLAAAGNCVGWVVYPAWDDNVIAVAGVDWQGRRWKGSSHGPRIDIAAPGENVYIARRSQPSDADKTLVEPGQGTSFAVALTAGCAALWLAHHGPDTVRAEAARRGTTVQELFRAALRQSAQLRDGWPAGDMGAGIVDAERLLGLDLGAITLAPPPSPPAGHPLAEHPLAPPPPAGHPLRSAVGAAFNWDRHGAEAGYLAFQTQQRSDPSRVGALESPVAPRPSPALAAALKASGAAARRDFTAPTIVSAPITPAVGAQPLLRMVLRQPLASGLVTESTAQSYLEGAGGQEMLDQFDRILAAQDPAQDSSPEITRLRDQVRTAIPEVFARVRRGVRDSADFTGAARIAAEALVMLTGRPALRVVDGQVSPDDSQLGQWAGDLLPARGALKPLVDAVGRIDMEIDGVPTHVGTGTVVGSGVVMTNRHVIDAFAEPIPGPGGRRDFLLTSKISIIFDEAGRDETRRFALTRVIAAGPSAIGRHADIGKLDMALLAAESGNTGGGVLPPPVQLDDLPAPDDARHSLLVVGYPASPGVDALVDPDTGKVSLEISDRLWELFQNRYSIKYMSPGEFRLGPGALGGDVRHWAFSHDATTLGGNSGSCVLRLDGLHAACGLHFGGAPKRQNLGHSLAAVRAAARNAPGIIDPAILDALNWAPSRTISW